jgi:hypothetical protein
MRVRERFPASRSQWRSRRCCRPASPARARRGPHGTLEGLTSDRHRLRLVVGAAIQSAAPFRFGVPATTGRTPHGLQSPEPTDGAHAVTTASATATARASTSVRDTSGVASMPVMRSGRAWTIGSKMHCEDVFTGAASGSSRVGLPGTTRIDCARSNERGRQFPLRLASWPSSTPTETPSAQASLPAPSRTDPGRSSRLRARSSSYDERTSPLWTTTEAPRTTPEPRRTTTQAFRTLPEALRKLPEPLRTLSKALRDAARSPLDVARSCRSCRGRSPEP